MKRSDVAKGRVFASVNAGASKYFRDFSFWKDGAEETRRSTGRRIRLYTPSIIIPRVLLAEQSVEENKTESGMK